MKKFHVVLLGLAFLATIAAFSISSLTTAATPPAAPGALTVAAAKAPSCGLTISWKAVATASGYEVYRKYNNEGDDAYKLIANTAAITYADSVPNDDYTYKVRALNAYGQSRFSPNKVVTSVTRACAATSANARPAIPAKPTAKTSLSCGIKTDISWASSPLATGYVIYRSKATSSGYAPIATTTTASFSDDISKVTGHTSGTAYYYKVVAFNSVGQSAQSPASAKALPSVQCATPVNPTVTVSAAPAGSCGMKMAWTSTSGATSYAIYRRFAGGASTLHTTVSGTSTTYTDTTLRSADLGKSVSYRIAARNQYGETPNGQENYTTVTNYCDANGNPVLSAPASVSAQTSTSCGYKINLSWAGVAGAQRYKILRTSTPGNFSSFVEVADSPLVTSASGTVTFTDSLANVSQVTSNTFYYYKIIASADGKDDSPQSAQVSTKPSVACAVPLDPAPTSFTVATSAVCGGKVNLSWAAPAGAGYSQYNVYRTTSPSGTFSKIASNITITEFTDTAPSAATMYYYRVMGTTPAGKESAPTAVKNIISSAACTSTSPVPTGLQTVAALCGGNTRFTWTPVPGATGYVIYRGTTPTAYSKISNNYATTDFSDAIIPATNYYYKVSSIISGVESAQSNPLMIRSSDACTTTVGVPQSVVATPQSMCNGSIQLSWSSVSNANIYNVYKEVNGTYKLIRSTGGVSFTDLFPSRGSLNSYKVTAENNSGESAKSAVASALGPQACTFVIDVSGSSGNNTLDNGSDSVWSKEGDDNGNGVCDAGESCGEFFNVDKSQATQDTSGKGIEEVIGPFKTFFAIDAFNRRGGLNNRAPVILPNIDSARPSVSDDVTMNENCGVKERLIIDGETILNKFVYVALSTPACPQADKERLRKILDSSGNLLSGYVAGSPFKENMTKFLESSFRGFKPTGLGKPATLSLNQADTLQLKARKIVGDVSLTASVKLRQDGDKDDNSFGTNEVSILEPNIVMTEVLSPATSALPPEYRKTGIFKGVGTMSVTGKYPVPNDWTCSQREYQLTTPVEIILDTNKAELKDNGNLIDFHNLLTIHGDTSSEDTTVITMCSGGDGTIGWGAGTLSGAGWEVDVYSGKAGYLDHAARASIMGSYFDIAVVRGGGLNAYWSDDDEYFLPFEQAGHNREEFSPMAYNNGVNITASFNVPNDADACYKYKSEIYPDGLYTGKYVQGIGCEVNPLYSSADTESPRSKWASIKDFFGKVGNMLASVFRVLTDIYSLT